MSSGPFWERADLGRFQWGEGRLALAQLQGKRQQKARWEETKDKLHPLQVSLIQVLWGKKQNINIINNTSVERQNLGSVNLLNLSKYTTAIQLPEKCALFLKKKEGKKKPKAYNQEKFNII